MDGAYMSVKEHPLANFCPPTPLRLPPGFGVYSARHCTPLRVSFGRTVGGVTAV